MDIIASEGLNLKQHSCSLTASDKEVNALSKCILSLFLISVFIKLSFENSLHQCLLLVTLQFAMQILKDF